MKRSRWGKRVPADSLLRLLRYETLKATWKANNPHASPREYNDAMVAICKQIGV